MYKMCGGQACSSCPYIFEEGSDKCEICPAGTYETTSNRKLLKCSNNFNSISGSHFCFNIDEFASKCASGYYYLLKSKKCEICPKGKYCKGGHTSYTFCLLEAYSREGSNIYIKCPTGARSSKYQDECIKCSAGQFSDEEVSECSSWPVGTHSKEGSKKCILYPQEREAKRRKMSIFLVIQEPFHFVIIRIQKMSRRYILSKSFY